MTDTQPATQHIPTGPGKGLGLELAAPAPKTPLDEYLADHAKPLHTSTPNLLPAQHALETNIVQVLRSIYDPEIPINIYDLGLIYSIDIDPENRVKINMTLTAPACPVAGSLPGQVEARIENIPEVKSADVTLVWEPPWDRSRLSEAVLLDLGMI